MFQKIETEVYLEAKCATSSEQISWRRSYGDRGRDARDFINHGNKARSAVEKGSPTSLPVLLYYGAGRLWKQHRNIVTSGPKSQMEAYKYCLDPLSDQSSFERWFKRMTQASIQRRTGFSSLSVVESAITSCIPGARRFYFDIELDEAVVDLEEEGLVPFNSLSDGFRNMTALVADIAHRAFRLNPHLENNAAVLSEGIVLIDEIDLHLHPKWQRRVVDDFRRAFPKLQFIVTTHSPFILQSVKNDEVIDVNGDTTRGYLLTPELDTAGPRPSHAVENRSIEDIAESVMGIDIPQRSERFQEMYDTAQKYYALLKSESAATQGEKDALKSRLDELSAPFSENIAYHAFLEMKRVSSGITSLEEEQG